MTTDQLALIKGLSEAKPLTKHICEFPDEQPSQSAALNASRTSIIGWSEVKVLTDKEMDRLRYVCSAFGISNPEN